LQLLIEQRAFLVVGSAVNLISVHQFQYKNDIGARGVKVVQLVDRNVAALMTGYPKD
jgi:hypothetical protein